RQDGRLTFGYISGLVHPDDIKLYDLAAQLLEGQTTSIDRAFRMRHSRGDWVWLRARCELVRPTDDPGLHLIGIAVDITEQKNLLAKTEAPAIPLPTAIEPISHPFLLSHPANPL